VAEIFGGNTNRDFTLSYAPDDPDFPGCFVLNLGTLGDCGDKGLLIARHTTSDFYPDHTDYIDQQYIYKMYTCPTCSGSVEDGNFEVSGTVTVLLQTFEEDVDFPCDPIGGTGTRSFAWSITPGSSCHGSDDLESTEFPLGDESCDPAEAHTTVSV